MTGQTILILLFVLCSLAYNPINFDPFTAATSLTALQNHELSTRISVNNEIWQGERDLSVYLPGSSIRSSDYVSCFVENGAATIISQTANSSVTTFQYDGTDYSMKFTNQSTIPQNFYEGNGKGFQFHLVVQHKANVILFVYTAAGMCSYNFPLSPGVYTYYIDFLFFPACNFTSVSGVEANILLNGNNTCSMTFFGIYGDDYVPSHLDEMMVVDFINQTYLGSSSYPIVTGSPSYCCSGSIVGGQRDLYFHVYSVASSSSFVRSNISNNVWQINTGYGLTGAAMLQYDGSDMSSNLDVHGLGGLDFTDNGLRNAIFAQVATNHTVSMKIEVYVPQAQSTICSRAEISVLPTTSISITFPFSSFSPSIDFTNVGALEIHVQLEDETDATIWDLSLIKQRID